MADFRTDLVNELRNQKYYLEQDLVRLVNNPITSYKARLDEIKECLFEIGKCNTAIALSDVYLPEQKQEGRPQYVPEQETEEGDIVTADEPTLVPQPLKGQSHSE